MKKLYPITLAKKDLKKQGIDPKEILKSYKIKVNYSLCTSKTKGGCKVKHLSENIPFKLLDICELRGVLRILSNLPDEDFCKNSQGLSVVNYICKKFHHSPTGFLIHVIMVVTIFPNSLYLKLEQKKVEKI